MSVKQLVSDALCEVHEDTALEIELTNLWALGETKQNAKKYVRGKTPKGLTRDSIFSLIDKIWSSP